MTEPTKKVSRRGARAAKRALRAAPLADEDRAVRPGLSGGSYQPLATADVARINEAVMNALENIGLAQAIPSCIELVTAAGGSYKDGRLYFPRESRHDIEISGSRVYFGTAGAAVHVVDIEANEYRDSELGDLYNMARLVDKLDNIHFFQRCLVARDIPEPLDMDVNTCYAAVRGTKKHVGTSWVEPHHCI